MKKALIGKTGFIGSNLRLQTTFDAEYHSVNIDEMPDLQFDLVVCAGAPATKWEINQKPKEDTLNLERLAKSICKTKIGRLILISTIDVFTHPYDVDETCSPDAKEPYGRNRAWLEATVSAQHPTTILRLPGMYGPGLKKNVIFDLLHRHRLEYIVPESRYQWYNVDRLWKDAIVALNASLDVLHLATEPLSNTELVHYIFPELEQELGVGNSVSYNLTTRHASLFGRRGNYIEDIQEVLYNIKQYADTCNIQHSLSRRTNPG